MADRNGYIGRAPADSAVTVARQTFSPTGVTTDFTFASGYVSGYFDIYLNGVKMIEGSDYTSTDGSTFSILNGGAENGDVIEAVAYKAFNAATIDSAPGNLSVGGNLTVTGSASFGSVAAGTSVSFATTAYALEGTPDISVRNVTGVAATFTGVVTLEDVTNIDSVGIVTAQGGLNVIGGGATITGITTSLSGINIVSGGLTVTGVATFADDINLGDSDKVHLGADQDLDIYHSGVHAFVENGTGNLYLRSSSGTSINIEPAAGASGIIANAQGNVELYHNNSKKFETTTDGVVITGIATATGVDVTGIVTATSFVGSGANLTNLPASGDSNDITACLFI